jgi:hypothetical protein
VLPIKGNKLVNGLPLFLVSSSPLVSFFLRVGSLHSIYAGLELPVGTVRFLLYSSHGLYGMYILLLYRMTERHVFLLYRYKKKK